jgi:anti-sigma regulatory factor (Ser/Thr protein kinase)
MIGKSQDDMPRLSIPNSASIHTLKSFLSTNNPFCDHCTPAVLGLHPSWAHMDPMALAMAAAWGGWCRRHDLPVQVENIVGQHTNYAARMKLFQHLDVGYDAGLEEHEEAGRFLPLSQIRTQEDLRSVIANVSALLHLDNEPDGLAAVQYCVSELIRNVLEHSGSTEGAYVCAQRYLKKNPKRVSIAVADCGSGISQHLGRSYPAALKDGLEALRLAMQPGITGARKDMYGTPDNAGAGLFITRAIAKATGGYFALLSGDAAFRLMRSRQRVGRTLYWDAFEDKRSNKWRFSAPVWQGTVAAVEIATEEIPDFHGFFQWIRKQLPAKKKTSVGKIKFT